MEVRGGLAGAMEMRHRVERWLGDQAGVCHRALGGPGGGGVGGACAFSSFLRNSSLGWKNLAISVWECQRKSGRPTEKQDRSPPASRPQSN